MNNQQAINLLKGLEKNLDDYCGLNDEGKTAFGMAINALNCSEIPNNSDTISRQQAIDALLGITAMRNTIPLDSAIFNIKKLPSVQPERKTGRWIESNPQNSKLCRLMTCSECGKAYIVNINVPYEDWTEAHKFCVECGADMRGEKE